MALVKFELIPTPPPLSTTTIAPTAMGLFSKKREEASAFSQPAVTTPCAASEPGALAHVGKVSYQETLPNALSADFHQDLELIMLKARQLLAQYKDVVVAAASLAQSQEESR
jgi:hypothetical protein